ncbi:MAG TPA: hypothetical protein VIM20_01940 [Candidatus Limnocylindrales bacterium]
MAATTRIWPPWARRPRRPPGSARVVAQKSEIEVVDAMRNQFTREQVALGRNDPDLAAVGEVIRRSFS